MLSCWEREEMGGFACALHPSVDGAVVYYSCGAPSQPLPCLWLPVSLFIKPPLHSVP